MIHLLDAMGLNKVVEHKAPKSKTRASEVQDQIGLTTTPLRTRVERKELTNAYLKDSVCFNGINKIVQATMSAGMTIAGENEGYFNLFTGKIGKAGGETDWNSLVEGMFRDCCIYGQTFVELIPALDKSQILDLDLLDATRMDYLRDANEKVALTKEGNPVGYVQDMPQESFPITVESKYHPPEPYALKNNQIYFPPERIAHIKLFTFEDRLFPIGLIEPIYRMTVYKMNLEKKITDALLKYSTPHLHTKLGDMTHEPSPEEIEKVTKKLKKDVEDGIYGTPYYYDITMLEAKNIEHLTEELNYYIEQQVAGLGMPNSFITGKGEDTNRATLVRQEHLAQLSLKNQISKVIYGIETNIFKRIALVNLRTPKYPNLVWGELAMEDVNSKAERLANYARYNVITPDSSLEASIRIEEGLPPRIENEGTEETPSRTDSGTVEDEEDQA